MNYDQNLYGAGERSGYRGDFGRDENQGRGYGRGGFEEDRGGYQGHRGQGSGGDYRSQGRSGYSGYGGDDEVYGYSQRGNNRSSAYGGSTGGGAGYDRDRYDESMGGGQQEQSHRGKGPKNYTRSDDRIKEDVCDHLSDEGSLDASEIEVEVSEREVTLSGTVDSRQAKRRAEDCAEDVSGVRHVQNNLRVSDQRTSGEQSRQSSSSASGSSESRTGSANKARENA